MVDTRKLSYGVELSDGQIYDIVPPSPTSTYRGGIIADQKTDDDNTEVKIGNDGKGYVKVPDTLEKTNTVEYTPTSDYNPATKKYVDDSNKNLDNSKVDKSVITDILNRTPRTSTYADYCDIQRTGKLYQTKVWKFASNPSSTCEKMLDNAGLVCEPSTDTIEGRDDYANIPLFDWFYCNYIRKDNTDIEITAMKGEPNYSETGSVDVGVTGMTFYWNYDTSNNDYDLLTISDSPNEELGLVPWVESINVDGTVNPYYVHSAYPSIVALDGLLRSQPNGKIARNQSHNNMITNYQKKGAGYWGAGACRNTFQMIFLLIKYATKNSQQIFKGVTSWSVQYDAAVERDTEDTYFPVTASQAANLEVGLCVSVGYASNNNGTLNKDRGLSSIHSYADNVKILRIEDMEDGNKAVYLDVESGFTTTPVSLTEELSSPIIMTSMHSYTGDTNNVIGKHDGSNISNTSAKRSYRIQGTEYSLGAYIVASDTVMDFQSDYSKNVYVAEKSTAHSSNDATIRSTYKLIGNIPASANGNGSDYWIGDISLDTETGVWHPFAEGVSDAQGWGDKVYSGGKTTSGTREYIQGGDLGYGSLSGSACLHCRGWLGWAYWHCCGCD